MASAEDLIQRILKCKALPMVPGISVQVLHLTQDPTVGVKEVADVMGRDPVLAGRVLRAANRLTPREVSSLHQAVVLLGMRSVSTLALGVSLSATFQGPGGREDVLDGVWRRSLYSALAGRMLADITHKELSDDVFLAGLFQDVGMLGLLAELEGEYESLIEGVDDHELLAQTEREILGVDHAEIGAAMVDAWTLPHQLVTAITYHHNPDQAPQADRQVVRLVWASRLAADVLLSWDTDGAAHIARDCLGEHFGLDGAQIQNLLERLALEAEGLAELFDVEVMSPAVMAQTLLQAQEALVQAALDADAEAQRLRGVNRKLTETAGQDRLTGLQNRTRLEEVMGPIFDSAKADGQPLAALFLDADHFKNVNDTYGHQIGDEVLRSIGAIMLRFCDDQAFRFGGEEIVCLLPGCDRAQAIATADAIRRAVEAEEIDAGNGRTIHVTISAGVAVASEGSPAGSAVELLASADQALYAAKEGGRNRTCVDAPKHPACT